MNGTNSTDSTIHTYINLLERRSQDKSLKGEEAITKALKTLSEINPGDLQTLKNRVTKIQDEESSSLLRYIAPKLANILSRFFSDWKYGVSISRQDLAKNILAEIESTESMNGLSDDTKKVLLDIPIKSRGSLVTFALHLKNKTDDTVIQNSIAMLKTIQSPSEAIKTIIPYLFTTTLLPDDVNTLLRTASFLSKDERALLKKTLNWEEGKPELHAEISRIIDLSPDSAEEILKIVHLIKDTGFPLKDVLRILEYFKENPNLPTPPKVIINTLQSGDAVVSHLTHIKATRTKNESKELTEISAYLGKSGFSEDRTKELLAYIQSLKPLNERKQLYDLAKPFLRTTQSLEDSKAILELIAKNISNNKSTIATLAKELITESTPLSSIPPILTAIKMLLDVAPSCTEPEITNTVQAAKPVIRPNMSTEEISSIFIYIEKEIPSDARLSTCQAASVAFRDGDTPKTLLNIFNEIKDLTEEEQLSVCSYTAFFSNSRVEFLLSQIKLISLEDRESICIAASSIITSDMSDTLVKEIFTSLQSIDLTHPESAGKLVALLKNHYPTESYTKLAEKLKEFDQNNLEKILPSADFLVNSTTYDFKAVINLLKFIQDQKEEKQILLCRLIYLLNTPKDNLDPTKIPHLLQSLITKDTSELDSLSTNMHTLLGDTNTKTITYSIRVDLLKTLSRLSKESRTSICTAASCKPGSHISPDFTIIMFHHINTKKTDTLELECSILSNLLKITKKETKIDTDAYNLISKLSNIKSSHKKQINEILKLDFLQNYLSTKHQP